MRAARSVGRPRVVAIDGDLDVVLTVEEMIHGFFAVPAGHEDGRCAELVDALGQLSSSTAADECLGFMEVRRHHGGEWKKTRHECFDSVGLEESRAGAREHDRIDDEGKVPPVEKVRHGFDDGAGEEHSRLCGVHADVVVDRGELRADEIHRELVHGGHAGCVLRRQRHDRGGPEAARGREGLQVGLDPGSAAGVRASNRQATWNHPTPFAGPNRIRFDGCDLSPAGAPRSQKGNVRVRMSGVEELRLVLTVSDFEGAVALYRDALGLAELDDWSEGDARVLLLDGGHATLELVNEAQAEMIDRVEVGSRVSGPVRVAFKVADSEATAERLALAGAEQVADAVTTPWNDRNIRMRHTEGMQLTLFTTLG